MTQTQTEKPKEVVFDEHGQTVEVHHEPDPVAEEAQAAAAGGDEAASAEAPAKIRIGDQEFSTEAEALAYAQRLQAESDAYQRGVNEAMQFQQQRAPGVTPAPAAPEPENVEELYTNPQEFLKKYALKIKSEVTGELSQKENFKAQSDSIWREFTGRHPLMENFRREVEQFVNSNSLEVQSIIRAKGREASYDFIATKLKSQFASYADALKPKRELPNGGGGPSPNPKAPGVTPPAGAKKTSTMYDQVRSLRKSR